MLPHHVTPQADPFESISPLSGKDESVVVHAFEEDQSMTIGKCGVNSNWIRGCFGSAELGKVANRPISCSGFLVGRREGVIAYVNEMARSVFN